MASGSSALLVKNDAFDEARELVWALQASPVFRGGLNEREGLKWPPS